MSDTNQQIEAWYRQFGEAVHRRCTRILGEEALAWDATQETFVRAFKGLDRFRGDSSPLTWLFTIADRRCFSILAQRRSLQTRTDRAAEESNNEPPPRSMEAVLLQADMLRRVLSRIDDDLRQIVVLRFLDDLDQEEIASILGISRKTVHRKLADFQKSARKILNLADALPDGERLTP